MTELDLYRAVGAAIIIFLAYLVRGIAGFGSGLIAVPLLALQFPIKLVVPVVVLLDYLGSIGQGWRNRKIVAWREQLPLIPFTVVGVALGLTLLRGIASAMLARALGVFIILYAVYQLLPLPPLRGTRFALFPCGTLGGLIGTLFGTGGPFYVIYFSLRKLEPSVQRATVAVNFLVDGGIRLVAYAGFGFLNPDALLAFAAALPIAAAALWIGGHLHLKFERRTYEKLISALLVASGVGLLLKGWG